MAPRKQSTARSRRASSIAESPLRYRREAPHFSTSPRPYSPTHPRYARQSYKEATIPSQDRDDAASTLSGSSDGLYEDIVRRRMNKPLFLASTVPRQRSSKVSPNGNLRAFSPPWKSQALMSSPGRIVKRYSAYRAGSPRSPASALYRAFRSPPLYSPTSPGSARHQSGYSPTKSLLPLSARWSWDSLHSPRIVPQSPISRFVDLVKGLRDYWIGTNARVPEPRNYSWEHIRDERTGEDFRDAIHKYMQAMDPDGFRLLAALSREHGEARNITLWRFAVRYLGEQKWHSLDQETRGELIIKMLVDELDLPHRRFTTLLDSWLDIILPEEEGEEELDTFYEGMVQPMTEFIEQAGFRAFLQVFEETFEDIAEQLFMDVISFEDGERIVHHPREPALVIASRVISRFMAGTELEPLTPSSERLYGLLPEWREHDEDEWSSVASDDDVATHDEIESLQLIEAAVDRQPVRWRRVFQRIQRHIDVFGLEATIRYYINRVQPGLAEQLQKDPGITTLLRGRLTLSRYRPEDNVAALLADDFVARARNESGASCPMAFVNARSYPASIVTPLIASPAASNKTSSKDAVSRVNSADRRSEAVSGEELSLRDQVEAANEDAYIAKHEAVELAQRLEMLCDDLEMLEQENAGLKHLVQRLRRRRSSSAADKFCKLCDRRFEHGEEEVHYAEHQLEINGLRRAVLLSPRIGRRKSSTPTFGAMRSSLPSPSSRPGSAGISSNTGRRRKSSTPTFGAMRSVLPSPISRKSSAGSSPTKHKSRTSPAGLSPIKRTRKTTKPKEGQHVSNGEAATGLRRSGRIAAKKAAKS